MIAWIRTLCLGVACLSVVPCFAQDQDVYRSIADTYRAGDDDRCVRLTMYALYDKPDSSHIYYYINVSSNYRIGDFDAAAKYLSYISPQDSFYLATRAIMHSMATRDPGNATAAQCDSIQHDLRSAQTRRDSVALLEALMIANHHGPTPSAALPHALTLVDLDPLSTPAWLYLVRKGVTGYDVELRTKLYTIVDTLQARPSDIGLRPVMLYCAIISAIASDDIDRCLRHVTDLQQICQKPSKDLQKLIASLRKLSRSQRGALIASAVAGSPGVSRWIHFASMPRAVRFRF
jgi:hypothetical protein